MTSEGWARANVWYDLKILPEPGSPLESIFVVLFTLRQDIEFNKTMTMLHAILEAPRQTLEQYKPDKTLDQAIEAYVKSMYPYWDADKKADIQKAAQVLHQWVSKVDHMEIQPIPTITSMLKNRQARRHQELAYQKYVQFEKGIGERYQ